MATYKAFYGLKTIETALSDPEVVAAVEELFGRIPPHDNSQNCSREKILEQEIPAQQLTSSEREPNEPGKNIAKG
jgi:hypothetical protein